jgi:sialate O-acetylesterase
MKICLRLHSTLIVALLALATRTRADVKLPAIFSNHMVIQAGVSAPVWGWADAGEPITITIAGQTKTVTTGKDSKWLVKLDPLTAGKTLTLTMKGKNTLIVNDVLVGDVWLCSGQSNMAMAAKFAKNFDQEKASANFPQIRSFTVTGNPALTPQDTYSGTWVVCTPETVDYFSAVAYFFGREIHQKTGMAVGLINSSVGGTTIEAWTSWDVQKELPELKPLFDHWVKMEDDWNPIQAEADYENKLAEAKIEGKPVPARPVEPCLSPNHPANLFNGKIAPLIPYAIRGVIWYQGESNTRDDAAIYGRKLALLINDWRARWGYEFPFAWVQLPEYQKAQTDPVEESGWALVREGMLQTLRLPLTGMAIALGTGEAADIHPKNKQEVGRRLALWALATIYGQKDVSSSGPLPMGHKTAGSKIVITFNHTDGGLVAKNGDLKGFAITGKDQKWVWANAQIDDDTVIVSHPDVKEPVAVRYAWANNPAGCNLFNGAGLPASPFRTDTP